MHTGPGEEYLLKKQWREGQRGWQTFTGQTAHFISLMTQILFCP